MKNIRTIAILAMAWTMMGCGGTKPVEIIENNETDTNENTDSTDNDYSNNTPEEVTKENFTQFPETPASEFVGAIYDDGYEIQGCSSADSVIVVPEEIDGVKVVSIGGYALSNMRCEAIVLPDTVTRIGEAAFTVNQNMKYIYLGKGVRSIGHLAFNQDDKLVEINIPEGTESIDSLAAYCTSLERIYAPASLIEIKNYMVLECPNVTVYTPSGSIAEAHAVEKGISVINE